MRFVIAAGALVAFAALAACAPAEPTDAEELARCVQVQDEWRALLDEMGASCDDVSDCAAVGTLEETCDANVQPALGECSGDGVNATAAAAHRSEVDALSARWQGCERDAFCDELGGCWLDCNFGLLACVDGRCVTQSSCLEP